MSIRKKIYLKVTHDKYELPLIVSEGAKELAEKEGVRVNTIYSAISHYEKEGYWSSYRRVEIEEEDEEDEC